MWNIEILAERSENVYIPFWLNESSAWLLALQTASSTRSASPVICNTSAISSSKTSPTVVPTKSILPLIPTKAISSTVATKTIPPTVGTKSVISTECPEIKSYVAYWINWAPSQETILGSGAIALHILDLSTWWSEWSSFTPQPLYPHRKSPWYPLDRRLGRPQTARYILIQNHILQIKPCNLCTKHLTRIIIMLLPNGVVDFWVQSWTHLLISHGRTLSPRLTCRLPETFQFYLNYTRITKYT